MVKKIVKSKPKINRDPTLTEYKALVKKYFDKGNMDYAYSYFKYYRREGGTMKFEDIVKSKKYKTIITNKEHGFYKIKKKLF